MACIVPRRIINRHYVKLANELNEDVSIFEGHEDYYVEVPCGRCINCVNSYMTKWRTRLFHEWEYMSSDARSNSYFVTLTFRDDILLSKDFDVYKCKYRFIDRLRKKYHVTPRYWMITEFGERKGRLHLHGLFFDVQFPIHELEDLWSYGIVDYSLMNQDCIKYCTSYITKGNDDIIVPKNKIQRVFCSPGIGKAYTDDPYNVRYHHPCPGILNPILQNDSNYMIAMPRYYREKIFSDDEREDMKLQYYSELSDDVIPPPPYRIGKRQFTDYTLYLKECKKYLPFYLREYKKPNYKNLCQTIQKTRCPDSSMSISPVVNDLTLIGPIKTE